MSTETPKRIFITPNDNITSDENNLVNLVLQNGESYDHLEPRKLFPISRTNTYITLLDSNGVEIAVIRDLKDLNTKSLNVIEYSLSDYYLVPYITAILNVTEKYGTLHWRVETNRGIKDFDIRNRNHDIRVYDDGCVRIRDSDDNRYIISDYRKLDKYSRQCLIADL